MALRNTLMGKIENLKTNSPWILSLYREAMENTIEKTRNADRERKGVFFENFSTTDSKGKAMKWMYDELWEILKIHLKRKETEIKDTKRKSENSKNLKETRDKLKE